MQFTFESGRAAANGIWQTASGHRVPFTRPPIRKPCHPKALEKQGAVEQNLRVGMLTQDEIQRRAFFEATVAAAKFV